MAEHGVAMTSLSRTTTAKPVAGGRSMVLQVLLICGILSSLLYVAMLVFVPMQWEGYSSASQTVSELSAIDAPTRPLWVLLGRIYTVLVVAFGLGVWASAGPNRALRVVGGVLVANAIIGLFWPPMHLRGVQVTLTDTLHIVWTMITLLLMMLAMGFGAAAFGKRFRVYSIATMVILFGFGALTGLDAPKIPADLPTPWVGVWERINMAAFLVWFVVLAVTLLRRSPSPAGSRGRGVKTGRKGGQGVRTPVAGMVAPGFEEVRAEFERNFAERGEIGAAVAAYWRGEKVVDLWGGRRTPDGDAPWKEATMVVVNSTTKGLAAMTLAVANARGWLDYEAPVARYWPEFAQNGKATVTVRQLLGHEAGLVLLDEKLTLEKLRDFDYMARMLARQTPAWPPGTRHGYHTLSIGLYMQELIRRVDPAHRTLGRFFHDEIAVPLDLEFYIGLPPEIPEERVARLRTLSMWRGLMALRYTPPAVTMKMISPGSLLRRSFVGLDTDPNDRRYLEVEVAAGNGVGTARAIARAYSAFAEGGAELGITPGTLAGITAPPVMAGALDVVLGVPSYFSLGFLRPGPTVFFGSSPRAFGAPGAGGSFAFADPDARLGYAYVMNKMDFYLENDPREKALRDAVYRAIARLTPWTRVVEMVGAAESLQRP
ncbi:MAG TPA: serine hydrolase [Gemmatimonadales bacterium]|nr:serine hydrolase [Gemmatimonadales bacterium]